MVSITITAYICKYQSTYQLLPAMGILQVHKTKVTARDSPALFLKKIISGVV